ncbi:zinc finger, CCHC-type containing protein, partial [Tanacetum coccineum]
MPEDGNNAIVEHIRKRSKWDNDDYVCRAKYVADDASSNKYLISNFTNYKMTDSRPVMEQYNELLDFKHTLKYKNEELTLIELGSHLRIEESLKVQDSDKPKEKNVTGPSVVNMVEHNNFIRYNENKGKRKHHDTKAGPNKKLKETCWKYEKPGHLKKDCKCGKVGNKANGSGTNGLVNGSSNSLKDDDDVAWCVDSRATVHVCKDRLWFKTYESLNDVSILHMGNESTTLVHRRGCVDLKFIFRKIVFIFNVFHVPNIRKNLVSSSALNNCGYKQVIESDKFVLSKHGVFIGFGYLSNQMFKLNIVNDIVNSAFILTSKLNDLIIWHARLCHVHFKRMQNISNDGLIPAFDMDTRNLTYVMHATPSLGNKKYFVIFIDDTY